MEDADKCRKIADELDSGTVFGFAWADHAAKVINGQCLPKEQNLIILSLIGKALSARSPHHKSTDIYDLIRAERVRQTIKWGQQSLPFDAGSSSDKFMADLAKQSCDEASAKGNGTWKLVAFEEVWEAFAEKPGTKEMENELVQCAAVFVSMIEANRRLMQRDIT